MFVNNRANNARTITGGNQGEGSGLVKKAPRRLFALALIAFAVYLVAKHPHSVPQFIHGIRSHR